MRRTITALAVAVLVAAGAGIVTAVPAAAEDMPAAVSWHGIKASPYVALGDSYSAAAGVHPQVPDAPATCSRSLKNFAHVIARRTEVESFTEVTCSGAETSDFFSSQATGVAPQLDAVTETTRLVTMTIGGNDGGAFGSILNSCVIASAGSMDGNPCEQLYGSKFTNIVADQTYPNLVEALTAVRKRAPRATVVILGYPRVMPDAGVPACYSSAMPISMGDVPYVTHWEETLNRAVEKAAAETGALFVDMWPSSADRDACQSVNQRWIEPLIKPVNADPVHPNSAGEAAMARQTLHQLRLDERDCDG